jgi:hypothetical protein
MFFMAEKESGLRKMQRVGAGNIDCINLIALRHGLQRGKKMFDGIIPGEILRLFEAAGVHRREFIFARFMGGIDKLAGDPVCANDSKTYH